MKTTKISATDLRSQTRDIIERVRFRGEHFIVRSFGKPVAVIIGIDEYNKLISPEQALTEGETSSVDPLPVLESVNKEQA